MLVQPRQSVAKKITIQSLMRPYEHLTGMTGTAWEERKEFRNVYRMKTVRFGPRLPLQRHRREDKVFADSDGRWEAVVSDIVSQHQKGRPVLVATRSVEKSQRLSQMLEDRSVDHALLNGVNHAQEAEIITQAGQQGVVTVAARMAGRGVEIKLGQGVEELGGMHVVGTERHILSRIDRQLAGRCGRRGSPGSVQFFVSAEDDVLDALPERQRRRFKRKCEKGASTSRDSDSLARALDRAQSTFAGHFAHIRRTLLVKDLAQEETERILFGQDRL
ncbi:Protein translocase subunit SecA [subsurface metagenome]